MALLLSPNPGPMQHRAGRTSLRLNQVSHIKELLVANLGGSSFFLTLLFPGLLSHHNQKPAESIMRDRQEGNLLGSGLLVGLSMWALDDPRSMKVCLALSQQNKPQKSVYLKELMKVLDIFYPLAEGRSSDAA